MRNNSVLSFKPSEHLLSRHSSRLKAQVDDVMIRLLEFQRLEGRWAVSVMRREDISVCGAGQRAR
jgi:hypothetical protein